MTVEHRVLEGGRDDWNGGPSYYATTHPNPHGYTWPKLQWKLTPKRNGRFQMNWKHENQRLNAEVVLGATTSFELPQKKKVVALRVTKSFSLSSPKLEPTLRLT